MKFRRLALIGCGLMGGSFAMALRKADLVTHVAGFSASPQTRSQALSLGVIDSDCSSATEAATGADLVLVAVPVRATLETFRNIDPVLSADCLLMDVGSTKCDVVAAARTALVRSLKCFVPAHPVAGKEVSGIEHADTDLYHQRQVILTPLPETPGPLLHAARRLWEALGSRVLLLSPEDHDASFAAVSHLPHLAAFAMVNAVARQPQGERHLAMAGPGFRDFSRIAASAPEVWRDILLANREEVLRQSQLMRQCLGELENAMARSDSQALHALITEASRTRGRWRLGGADSDV
jgi:prephenate dehydrogenase